MPKAARRHADLEEFGRETIAAWKESGQTVRAFCAARGVGQATFYARRRDLVARDHPRQPTVSSPNSNPSFAAARMTGTDLAVYAGNTPVRSSPRSPSGWPGSARGCSRSRPSAKR